jgi:hypothetical protein
MRGGPAASAAASPAPTGARAAFLSLSVVLGIAIGLGLGLDGRFGLGRDSIYPGVVVTLLFQNRGDQLGAA